ncbi:hypothetical protein BO71DRAFT_450739 [Aspergillus ellipticus CBS 707.79]|uniref:Uncharacterized protein n=1 Tax=Aspergillus ellipticus CBS 707.79 TaxID=1448320 RepID=A0A319DZ68_9EURO|nr:hypothetical protein BO71DRAFT_450739 [Aspergillus ellipticus CBS 707.79]
MDYNAADLTSVLRTLSALSNQQQPQPPPHPHPPTQSHRIPPNENEEDDVYEPSESLPQLPAAPPPQPPNPAPTQTQPRPQPGPTPHAKPAEDTSTITAWPAALRYVMRTVAQSEEIQRRIRYLIQRQHDHEKQWWQGREALLRKQQARAGKKKELDAVLRSVGAPVDDSTQVSTAEEDRAELTNYDAKVYKASRQMSEAMVAELRALRIPFFSIRNRFVSESSTIPPVSDPGPQQTISRDALSGFQRRMLELLQDLCRE